MNVPAETGNDISDIHDGENLRKRKRPSRSGQLPDDDTMAPDHPRHLRDEVPSRGDHLVSAVFDDALEAA